MPKMYIHRSPNMFTLIGIGTGAAYLYSTVATFLPQIFPDSFHSAHGGIDLYFESAAVITALVLAHLLMLRIPEEQPVVDDRAPAIDVKGALAAIRLVPVDLRGWSRPVETMLYDRITCCTDV